MATPPTRVGSVSPTAGWANSTATKTSPAFNVQAGDLLVLYAFTADQATIAAPTWTGSGTWTLQRSVTVGSYCSAVLYTCLVTANGTGVTVSQTRSTQSFRWNFRVDQYRDHGGLGVTAVANTTGAPSVSLTTSADSAVVCGSADWNAVSGSSRTWRSVNGAAMTESDYSFTSGAYTVYGGHAPDTAAGTTTVGLTAPTGQKFSIVAAEILGVDSAPPQTVTPTGIATPEQFGTPVVTVAPPPQTSGPSGIVSAQAFGAVALALSVALGPSGIPSGQAFGTPSVSTSVASTPTGIPSGEALGAPTITQAPPATNLAPSGIGTAEALGTPSVSGSVSASPSGIPSAETFGAPSISGSVSASPSGIPTAEAFGTPAIGGTISGSPSGIPSGGAFGTPSLSILTGSRPNSIPSGEQFGSPTIVPGAVSVAPTSIGSALTLGSPSVSTRVSASPASILSALALGVPSVSTSIDLEPVGIGTREQVGEPTVLATTTVVPEGIESGEAFGTPRSLGQFRDITLAPEGVSISGRLRSTLDYHARTATLDLNTRQVGMGADDAIDSVGGGRLNPTALEG